MSMEQLKEMEKPASRWGYLRLCQELASEQKAHHKTQNALNDARVELARLKENIMYKEDLKELIAKNGLTKDIARDVLKLIEDADLDDKDAVQVRIVTIKSAKKKDADQDKDQKEAQSGPSKEDWEQLCDEQTRQLVRLFQMNRELTEENEKLHARLAEMEK